MRQSWDDLRFGVRLLARSPGFTLAALVTLALGIGANATLFSLGDALYVRTPAVPDASRLVHGYQTRRGGGFHPLSLADYVDYRAQSRSFEALAAHYSGSPMHVVVDGEPVAVTGSVVTASYFDVLRIRPELGRFFRADEDRARDRDAVAVISHGFWQRQFSGRASAIGGTIRVNSRAFTIVGVAPRGFEGVANLESASAIWIPSAMFQYGYRYCDAFARDCTIVEMLGRLKPEATIPAAQAELDVVATRLRAAHPASHADVGVVIVPARGASPGRQTQYTTLVSLLLGGVALLLLIACANVAGLLLARGTARRHEIAIRLALGASRARLVRQLLAESAVLAVGGGVLGLLLTLWAKEVVASFYATDYAGRPLSLSVDVSGWVLAATAALCAVTAVLCGLAPALQSTRADLLPGLKLAPGSVGRPRSRMRDALVAAQVALSMVLLVGAGLLVRSVWRIDSGPGVDPDRIILLRLRPSLVGYEAERARAFQREVIRRLEALPGIEAASPSENLPLFAFGGDVTFAASQPGTTAATTLRARSCHVGGGYIDVLGLPLLAGRDFDDSDRPGTTPVVLVDDLLAASMGGPAAMVGRLVAVDGTPHQDVGVVRAAQYHSALEPAVPYLYRNYWQQSGRGFSADSRTHVRVSGDARAMMPAIRRAIAAIDPSVPISEDYPLKDRVRFHFQPVRLAMSMLVGLGGVALVLSIVGLYGVVAFVTAMRTREIAIRVAVGATRRDIRALVVGHGARLAAGGAVVGLATAFGASRVLASLLYGVSQHDTGTFLIAPAILLTVSLVASWLPVRRAVRIDPARLLREE